MLTVVIVKENGIDTINGLSGDRLNRMEIMNDRIAEGKLLMVVFLLVYMIWQIIEII